MPYAPRLDAPILAALTAGPASYDDLMRLTGFSRNGIYTSVRRLAKLGKLEPAGRRRNLHGCPSQLWRLPGWGAPLTRHAKSSPLNGTSMVAVYPGIRPGALVLTPSGRRATVLQRTNDGSAVELEYVDARDAEDTVRLHARLLRVIHAGEPMPQPVRVERDHLGRAA